MAPKPDLTSRRRWGILAVLCLSLVLVVLDNTVTNVAIPTLARELDATGSELQWIIDSYVLVFGALLLTMGALGDRFGRRGALQWGLLIVGGSSVAALAADTADAIIGVRVVMGIGAALVMPATLSIIADVFPPGERGRALGIWAAFAGVGGMLGLLVGGWLLEHFAWQSIFLMNVPVAGAAMLLVAWLVPTSRDPSGTKLDLAGTALSVVALGALLFGIIEAPSKGWTDASVLWAFGTAAVAWPLFIWWETSTPHPMLPMRLFRDAGFSTGNLAVGLAFFTMFSVMFAMSQYMQFVRGYTPLETGARFLPMVFGVLAAAPQSDRLARRIGVSWTVGLGLAIAAGTLAGLAFLEADTPFGWLALGFFGLGLGMGFTMAPSTALIMESTPAAKAGIGSAMNDTSREVGGALGIAILGSLLNSSFSASVQVPAALPPPMREAASDSIGAALGVARQVGGEAGAALAASARLAFMDGLAVAYLVGAGVLLTTAVVVALFMPRRKDLHIGPGAHGAHAEEVDA